GARVDLIKEVALLDRLAVLEVHLNQVTLDPGAHLHIVRCVGAAGELHVVGDLALERLADADLDRLRPRGRWVLTAPRQKHRAEKEGRKAHGGTTHSCTSCSSFNLIDILGKDAD